MLKLPRLLGDGCVLQQGKPAHIYGLAAPSDHVSVTLQGQRGAALADETGRWAVTLPALAPGGPYPMQVESGAEALARQVYVGEVWLCAGQSNMELPMERVRDRYPEELNRPATPTLRMFKITEHYVFDGPLAEHESGAWQPCGPETIRAFSASAYFFGRELLAQHQVPIGLIDTSKGGSRIEAWMPRAALADYPALLREADRYRAPDAAAQFTAREEAVNARWHTELLAQEQAAPPSELWTDITLPGFLADQAPALAGFCGSLLLRRRFTVPDAMLRHNALAPVDLWLGTLVDSDQTSVNGTPVGETGYQYPPRKYKIPAGVLRAGENELCIRLVCDNGVGRMTPGKAHCLFTADDRVELDGPWQYRVLHRCAAAPAMDFICRKATGLYNGLVAPCQAFPVRGVFWYQGESNDFRPGDYEDLLKKLIAAWRAGWGEALPFVVAQLPNFAIDLDDAASGWPEIREAQNHAGALPGVAVTVNLDLGEDNDLHPLNKKGIGQRAAQAAQAVAYGAAMPAHGPQPRQCTACGSTLRVAFSGGALHTADGQLPGEFELAGADGRFAPAAAALQNDTVTLQSDAVPAPLLVRYAWCNAPRRGLLCGADGRLVSPFRLRAEICQETN